MILRAPAAVVIAAVLAGCVQAPAPPSASPVAKPTPSRPKFELATYMYALQTKGKIRIGGLEQAIPFAVRDSSGLYIGFEVDLGRELAKAIFGARQDPDRLIEWVAVDRSTAASTLTAGRADIVVGRLAIPPPGGIEPAIDFTDPYFVTGERILIRSSNDQIKDLPDLDTMTVCELAGSGVADHVIDANPFARTLSLDSYAACLGALQRGQVDAIGADEAILWNLMKLDGNTKLVGRPLAVERYAIGVKRSAAGDRQGFLPFLNAWLAGAIRDGTWARLYSQHVMPYSHERKSAPTP